MKILYAASEALPFMASGGLADVAGSLPRALRNRRQACRVVMPLYGTISEENREKMKFVTDFTVALSWRNQYCGVYEANVNGVIYYLLDNEYYFKRDNIYGYADDAERFAFFSKAVLELLHYIDYQPDIIHANDWQTALIPVFLNTFYRAEPMYRQIKTVFTIHNIQYQGKVGNHLIGDLMGLPYYQAGIVEYEGCVNFMKGAIDQADLVTTVSPTYAQEILDPWYSHGLDHLLRERQYKLRGILNGIDTTAYDPATDPALYKNFTKSSIADKKVNKKKLCKEVGIKNSDHMLIGMVTRLVSHKGLDLVKYIFDELMSARKVSVVMLGSGDYIYEEFFKEMQARYPGRVAFWQGFIPDMAHKIYAAADAFLMPSQSEPCGLAQMVSLRYGTIPVVRETGGLKDSIVDLGGEGGNGFTFKSYNAHDMLAALDRAIALYEDKDAWNKAVQHAMACDFSWSRSAAEYIACYQSLVEPEKLTVAKAEETAEVLEAQSETTEE